MKPNIVNYIIFLILVAPIITAQQFPANLEAWATQTYTFGSKTYTVDVLVIEESPLSVTFKVNGEIFRQISQGSSLTLQDGVNIQIHQIFDGTVYYIGSQGNPDSMTFSFFNYCGDQQCSLKEDCGSCASDCPCTSGDQCIKNKCTRLSCGDGLCSSNENCVQDSCCRGKIVRLDTEVNCGTCGNRCGLNLKCIQGQCKKEPICGDTICELDEFCSEDCDSKKFPQAGTNSVKDMAEEVKEQATTKDSSEKNLTAPKASPDKSTKKHNNFFARLFILLKEFFS